MQAQAAPRLRSIDFESPVGAWRVWLWTPAPDLAEAVASLWATEAQTVAFREKIVPRETVELMINFGGRQTLHPRESGGERLTFQRAWVSGLQTRCLDIESPTSARLLAASLRPAHAGPLLGIKGEEITDRVVALDEVISRDAEELAARLEESPTVIGRFLLFEDFLRRRLRTARYGPHPTVCRAVRNLIRTGGQSPIRGLSEEIGCSPRYLETQVREQAGLSPKRLARLLRFSRAIEQIQTQPAVDWTSVAGSCGYYDQAHFNRDFRQFTGVTPGDFLARRDPSSQAMLVD
jgi:AraC-like DNA-binding protein